MKKVNFGKLFKFLPKSKIKAGEGKEEGKYPFYTSSKIQSKWIDEYIYSGDSLIFGTGGNANIHYANDKFSTSTDCFVAQVNSEEVYTKYVFFYIKSHIELLERGFKGAGLKHISKKYISNIKIPLPETLDEQIKIANLLTQVETLIEKRKEGIRLLDELLKSTFLDMFGDPVLNPKGWETKTIEELVKKDKYSLKRGPFGGALKKEIFVSNGYLVYEQYHALNNDFSMARYFITEDKFQELKAFEVKEGDIIISCSGVYLGKLAIVPPNAPPGIINQALLKISLNEDIMNNILFTYIFTNKNFRNKFFKNNRGAGVPNFPPMKDFKTFKFICPPKYIQDKFATIVQQVEAIKKHYQQSLDELNQLFGSLSQRAFKGELDLSKMEIEIPAEDTWTKKALAKQEAYEKALEERKYKSDMSAVETVTVKTIPTKNIETYIMNLLKDDNFDIDEIKHQFGIHYSYDDFKKQFYGLLEEGKIIQEFDTQNKKMKFKAR